ncbi:MAG: Z1 domain-containing protein [Ignavibacteriaceae bacterium]|jgi:hypothetical protein
MTEVIEIQNNINNGNWIPFVGDETNELLRSNSKLVDVNRNLNIAGQRVRDEAYRIMKLCGNPNISTNNETGIVIGFVQSGKTLSFTTLTALARDNNYQLVILIAGTSELLLDQSTKRLRSDLRLESRFDRKWTLLQNPRRTEDRETIETTLAQWADQTFSEDRCRTLLITVMKQKDHLLNLRNLFSGLQLVGVPVLIIDDEGDQASLNTAARRAARRGIDIDDLTENDVSTVYRRITGLRSIFPHHTFLQYTATPQANLFINITDRLSPNFIKLLTPGEDYIGGIQFFQQNPELIVEIPLADIPVPSQPFNEVPGSLLRALQIFFLGVVADDVYIKNQRNRSMLVHPSRLQWDHNIYIGWVREICHSWQRLLSGNDQEEKASLLAEFRIAYDELLASSGDSLPSFEKLTDHNLIHSIQYTQIVEVNTRQGPTPQIHWHDWYSWILIGGQSMDRGFTVEGLTVTYMPRNLGVNNADTILQRARFFGYKRGYLGFCRVYLPQVTIDAFNAIIEHEEDVRERLVEFDINNKHLNTWAREAVLDQMLNLTRSNVLYDDLDRDRFGNDWYRINAPHDTEAYIATNRIALFDYLSQREATFTENEGHENRTDVQKHLFARISMRDCLENLLNKFKFTRDSDSATYSSLRGILKRYLEEHTTEQCLIYLMSANSLTDWKRRTRRLDRNDEIQQLFQGRNPLDGEIIYPGDSEIKNNSLLTVQIHLLDIKDTTLTSVPTLAIWVPEHIGRDIIRQV